MQYTEENLKKLIDGIKKGDNDYIYKLQIHFMGAMKDQYYKYIGNKFGNSDEDDVINISLHKIVSSIHMFRGSNWKEFKGYVFKIIINTVINYRRTLMRKANAEILEYSYHNITESLENKVISKIIYSYIIENSNLSKRENEYKMAILKHGSIEEYLRENDGNPRALNQAGYRMRQKLRKTMEEHGIKFDF
ncbi:sigma-70 family RNA polymerase sigma factor [Clostridium tyrobutyricum]|jgi:DNA-directed RNA polymerase specialized sigma24 family protein|uniref:sigma-70 family RNA polymerase sigma factor n=1 Tax=Clostridium tyrobutyricum TaxID=1519 RepID=UPI001C39267E|nr:sigma-70 family RNA polymerase sigma factor [Clostridium tyrobutyricum]MBV4440606.1 sigma-70 family RNA polymerase sigma factor [Clostridium tyrobutyricum]MBV4447149.1 sigma-70 family RNA polymerase sigma factor [Clostridium tyrobutyricum]